MRPTLCHEARDGRYPEWEAARYRLVLWPESGAPVRCPSQWVDRYAIWMHGGTIRVSDEGRHDVRYPTRSQRCEQVQLPNPGDAALALSFSGWDWMFSHRGLYQAALVWKAWDVGTVHGMPLWASWLNGLPGALGIQEFYPCPSPWDGFWAASNGRAIMGFYPQVAGPVVRWIEGKTEWAPGLVGGLDGRYRGEQLPMGVRRGLVVEPVVADGGWFWLGIRYVNRRL